MTTLPFPLITQLIIFYKEVFEREGLDLWLKPYSILSTAKTTGLIEVLVSTFFDALTCVGVGGAHGVRRT